MPETTARAETVKPGTPTGDGKPTSSTVCALCLEKLSSAPHVEHTTRTTLLRPVASERLTGKLAAPAGDSHNDDTLALVVTTAPGAAGSAPASVPRHGSSVSPQLPLGEAPPVARHFGSYEVLGEISRGSFGVVYRAKQQGLDRVVALKVLLAGAHASIEAVGRFQREAKAVARLKHPNIVPVYDIGTHESHHYFAMEFVEGHALSELIAKNEVTTQRALEVAEALADALESAHRAGVIHRDIKPSNIIVDAQGQPHITDFGLAKQVDLDTKYTMSGTTLGTPAYMPPEQARGEIEKIDARSDVYAVGAVLYEMLTGRTPFFGRSLLEVVVAVINEPVQPPRRLNPRIHRDVQTIVMKCLEKDPRQRYASAADLRDDLQRFRSGEAIRARPAGLLRRTGRQLKRHRMLVGTASVALAAMILSYYQMQESEKQQEKIIADKVKVEKELVQVKVSQQPVWRPDWWFPPKDPATLVNDEQRKLYTIPEGKGEAFKGFARGKDVPDPQLKKTKSADGAEQQEVEGARLSGGQTLVSPEQCRFFGDVDARICFTVGEWAPDRKLRIGLQSLANGAYDGIPYLVEYAGGSVRLFGPVDLYSHTSVADGDRKGAAQPKFEVKAEKEAPDLVPGRYTFTVHREGMLLSTLLAGPAAFQPVSLEIKDVNLSNWVFKNTQLVIRQPPPGLLITSAEVQRKLGGEGGNAFSHFSEGEYNVAEGEFKAIEERGDDRFLKARAKFQLGLLQEICQPRSGKELTYYTDALNELEQLPPDELHAAERNRLATELRFRRLIRFARNRMWPAVTDEIYRGWGQDGKIGEPLAWELRGVLELALQEPPKDAAAKEPEKAPGIQAALELFQRLGLTPGSVRFGRCAVVLADTLVAARRFDDLPALYDAYSSRMLSKPLCEAIGRALEADQFGSALTLLGKMDARTETDAILRARAVCDVLSTAMKTHRYVDVGRLYSNAPTMQLLKILCKEIEAQAKDLADNDNESRFYQFTSKALSAVVVKPPPDPSAMDVLCAALDKVAAEIINGGRVSKLIKLHEAFRGTRAMDPHLARSFAEAVTRLAAAGSPGAREQALSLLTYCAKHVQRDDPGLQRAVVALARHDAAVDDARSYGVILKLQRTYATPQLLKLASEMLLEMRRSSRYEEMVIFFSQARVEFGSDARVLTPLAVAALENVNSSEQRAQLLSSLWFTVHGELEQRQLAAADRQWQMEFADIELVLNQWEKAREHYLALYNTKDIEPELLARVSFRLGVLAMARPGGGRASDVLLPLLAMENLPEEYKLAARLLVAPDRTRLEDLDAQLKALNAPLRLSAAEWDLCRGLRLRLDGNQALARDVLSAAARKSDPARAWVNSVASQLLRSNSRSPDEERRGDSEKPLPTPAPQPPAPSLNFPKRD